MPQATQTTRSRRQEKIADTLRRFVRRGARGHISKLLAKARPGDVALMMRGLTPDQRFYVFQILEKDYLETAGEVLSELDPQHRSDLITRLTPERVAAILEPMSVDDAVYVVSSLPPELHEKVLDLVDRPELRDIQSHLGYADDTAGRIMDPEFFTLPESTTAGEAIEAIRHKGDIEMIFYVYVVDRHRHLVGVVSLRQLLIAPPELPLADIMTRSLIKVHTDTDQEEVAQVAARYDLLAIPVVDDDNRLVGVVTVDDIIDVMREEATEDFFKMVGSSDNELLYQDRSFKVAAIRLPWLLVNLVGGVVAGMLLAYFQVSLKEALFLLTFVPVITGMGGNIGTQTSTIAVRGLASGRIAPGEGRIRRFLWQQAKVGVVLGVICAALVAIGALLLEQNLTYSVVVGGAMLIAMVLSSVNGALIPVLFQRLGIDPAIASGPLVTTSNDVTGILVYFGLATALIKLLVR